MTFREWLLRLLLRRPAPPATTPPAPPSGPGPALPGDLHDQLLGLHNDERARAGLAPLAADGRLAGAAGAFAAELARRGVLTHQGADGSWPWDRIPRFGWPAGSTMGENAALGQRTPTEAVADWMTSPGHRANVLGSYTHVGFGVADGAAGRSWVADFGSLPR